MRTPVPILLYHSISSVATPRYSRWAVRPETFAEQMSYLRDHRYTPITVSQLATAMLNDGVGLPQRPVVVTFDDGLADFYTGALPALQSHGFAATLYITTGFVEKTSRWLRRAGESERPMLTWAQIADISASGIECGAHSRTHRQLDILPLAVAQDEIVRCKAELEQRLGRPVATFAYPHGYYSGAVHCLVQQAGYSSACAVKHAISSMTDDRFAFARIVVENQVGQSFADLLSGCRLSVAPTRERLRTTGWRVVRRTAAQYMLLTRGLRFKANS